MPFPTGHHPGAEWHKTDLQCHTPRDLGWTGSQDLPGGSEEKEAARAAWAASFVTECVAKGLRAVAVTDHHDVCMVEYVKRHVDRDENCDLKVFAGVEITCDDDVQCLALFDANSTAEDWGKLLSKFPRVTPAARNDAKTCEIGPCGFTIKELFDTVRDDDRLQDVCLLVPHFGNTGTHKSLNAARHHPRFVELDCDGFYFEARYAELDDGTLQKAKGNVAEWGSRRRAMIATGDNKRATWERLGAHDCWIKIGEFSTEALRQAFLADEARISHIAPSLPAERIIGMSVLSSLTGTEPMSLTFNAGHTAFIGGRGSGKSSLLEYLRFALGRAEPDLPKPDLSGNTRRERGAELLNDTLREGFVEVVIERAGTRETWRRTGASRELIEVCIDGREPENLTPEAAQRRFRARAFQQKQLSTTMTDPSTAADDITGIVAAEALDRRRKIDRDIDNAKRTVTTALRKVASHWQAEYEHAQAKSSVDDLARRIAGLNKRLKDEGVKQESLTVLEQAPVYGRARNFFKSAQTKVGEDLQAVNRLKDGLLRIEVASIQDALGFPEVAEAEMVLAKAKGLVVDYLSRAVEEIRALGDLLTRHSGDFETSSKLFDVKLEQATAEQQTNKTLLDDLKRLTQQQTEAEAALSAASGKVADTLPFKDEFAAALGDFDDLLEQRRTILSEAATLVGARSQNLSAKQKRDREPQDYIAALSAMLEGSTVRDVPAKCAEWVRAIVGEQGVGWSKVREDVVKIYRLKIVAGKPQEPAKDTAQKIKELCFGGVNSVSDPQAARIFTRLTDQIVGDILAAVPRDFIQLTYIDESNRRVSFERASPGQQASALLELLLKQEAGTLVIDQPEDDLDNRVIMRIVDLIKTSKNGRQLIFATHNPNLVVNGDADKVVALQSTPVGGPIDDKTVRIVIDVDGAIETPAVRDAITTVMEGGREAFDLRSRKYKFEPR